MKARGPAPSNLLAYAALFAALAAAFLPLPERCRTWRVTIDRTGDAPTIQAAIDSCAEGDEVLVGPGTYTWANQGTGETAGFIRFLTLQEGITLRSELGPENTILDAEHRITVDGFTIKNGVAPVFGDYVGGGLFVHIAREVVRSRRALHVGEHQEHVPLK